MSLHILCLFFNWIMYQYLIHFVVKYYILWIDHIYVVIHQLRGILTYFLYFYGELR